MIRVVILLLALWTIMPALTSLEQIYELSPHHQAQSIIVVGRTGVGKSTLCNLLANNKLISFLDHRTYSNRYKLEADDPDATSIGHDYRSETLIPKLVRLRDDRDTLLWDIPGSAQNRGPLYELISGFSMKQLFKDFQNAKVIVMLSQGEILEQWDYRMEASIQWLSSSMLDQRNVVLIISKVSTSQDVIYQNLRLKIRDLYDKMHKAAKILEHLIAFERVAFFYTPKRLAEINKTQNYQRACIFQLLKSVQFQRANLPVIQKSYIFMKRLTELEPQLRGQMSKLIVSFQQKCLKLSQKQASKRYLIDILSQIQINRGNWNIFQKLKQIPELSKVVKDQLLVFHRLLQYIQNAQSDNMEKELIVFVWSTIDQLMNLLTANENTWGSYIKSWIPSY